MRWHLYFLLLKQSHYPIECAVLWPTITICLKIQAATTYQKLYKLFPLLYLKWDEPEIEIFLKILNKIDWCFGEYINVISGWIVDISEFFRISNLHSDEIRNAFLKNDSNLCYRNQIFTTNPQLIIAPFKLNLLLAKKFVPTTFKSFLIVTIIPFVAISRSLSWLILYTSNNCHCFGSMLIFFAMNMSLIANASNALKSKLYWA